jgi:hypothetical protein
VRSLVIAIAIGLILAGCWSEQDLTGSANKCATDSYPSYSAKNLKQCVDVCIKCERGTTTTCSTPCTLRGAR